MASQVLMTANRRFDSKDEVELVKQGYTAEQIEVKLSAKR
jgi:hypothetical protein